LKNFASHLVTDSDQTVLSAITTAMFEAWVLQQMHNKDMPNDARRMEAIDKFNIKDLNPFNGSTVDWPGTFRKTTQIVKNWGMGDHLDGTSTPPGPNTHAHKLWDKQNTFLKTALTARWTGGQASVIVRQHDSAQTMFKETTDHHNSASNKSASITLTMSKMTRLVFDHQSNVLLIAHLKTMQDDAADLEDCGNKLDDAHFKSLLRSSIKHSAFEKVIDGLLSSAIAPPAVTTELTHKANRMSEEVPSKRNTNFQKSNENDKDKKGNDKDDSKKNSKWWAEPKVWRKMSAQAKAEHNGKKQAHCDSLKGNGVPESNCAQSNQMTAIVQLLAMPEAERTQLCSQANTLQQLLNSSQQNNAAMAPTPTVVNNGGNPAPASANIGNILTQLLQANTANNTGGDQRRLFAAKTCVAHANVDAPKKIVKNIDIAARQAPGLKCFLDFSDVEPSEKGLVNCDFSADDCSAAPSLEISHCSEHLQHDYIDDEEQSLGGEGDWEPLSPPPTFMDNVVPIDVADKPVDLQQLDFFSDALEAPLESVQNELEVFDDAAEDIFCDAVLTPEETPLIELCQPDVFVCTPEHIVCGIRQCFFNLTRHIGQSDSVAFEGCSPIDSGADTVFCGQGCRNEELDDNRK